MKKRVVWISGARGFIGRHLARVCSARGDRVIGIGHGAWSDADATQWGIETWLDSDISSSALTRLADSLGFPDVFVHLAGGSSVGIAIDQPYVDFFRTVASTVDLLEWLRLNSPKTNVVAVSSAAVYGGGYQGLISEDALLKPFSPYGYHKLMMESLCRSYAETYGLQSVIARLFSVYGDGLTKQLLWDSCIKLNAGAEILKLGGTGDELRDWVHVDDVAVVLAELGAHASNKVPVFNVASGTGTSVASIAKELITAWQSIRGSAPVSVGFTGKSRLGDPFSLVGDVRALSDIGLFCSRDVKQGIKEYVDWFCCDQQGCS